MITNRVKRMEVVIELARRTEDQAANNFKEAKNVLEAERQRLADIELYYQSYSARFAQDSKAISASKLANARQFLNHLTDAKVQQYQNIEKAEQQLDDCRAQWQKTHLKHKALEDFSSRIESEDLQAYESAEQKKMDDWVNQRHSVH